MPLPPQYGVHRDRDNNRVALNYAGTRRLSVSSSGAAVVGTFGSSGALTVTAGGLTVTAGGASITGTTVIDTSCTSLTLTGLPTAACCLGSGEVYITLSGCCCCIGTLSIVP